MSYAIDARHGLCHRCQCKRENNFLSLSVSNAYFRNGSLWASRREAPGERSRLTIYKNGRDRFSLSHITVVVIAAPYICSPRMPSTPLDIPELHDDSHFGPPYRDEPCIEYPTVPLRPHTRLELEEEVKTLHQEALVRLLGEVEVCPEPVPLLVSGECPPSKFTAASSSFLLTMKTQAKISSSLPSVFTL